MNSVKTCSIWCPAACQEACTVSHRLPVWLVRQIILHGKLYVFADLSSTFEAMHCM